MHGAIHPLPQYDFIAWFPVKKIPGTTLPLSYENADFHVLDRDRMIQGCKHVAVITSQLQSTIEYLKGKGKVVPVLSFN
jgi:hypothetical protein